MSTARLARPRGPRPEPRKIIPAPFWFSGDDDMWTELAGWYSDEDGLLDPNGESKHMTAAESIAKAKQYVKDNPRCKMHPYGRTRAIVYSEFRCTCKWRGGSGLPPVDERLIGRRLM